MNRIDLACGRSPREYVTTPRRTRALVADVPFVAGVGAGSDRAVNYVEFSQLFLKLGDKPIGLLNRGVRCQFEIEIEVNRVGADELGDHVVYPRHSGHALGDRLHPLVELRTGREAEEYVRILSGGRVLMGFAEARADG